MNHSPIYQSKITREWSITSTVSVTNSFACMLKRCVSLLPVGRDSKPGLKGSSYTRAFSANPASTKSNNFGTEDGPPLFLKVSKWNMDSYGLSASLVDSQTLQTIRQLPEVESVLIAPPQNANERHEASEKLRRAVEIFQAMNSGGAENMACLAMLAETIGVAGSVDTELILDQMFSTESLLAEVVKSNVLIAKAKSAYHRGDFAAARAKSEELLDDAPNKHPFGTVAVARTIQGASRLQGMQSIDDAFSVRDPFRMTVKYLERNRPGNKLALAAAHYNLGTAEAIYAQAVSKFNDVSVPLDYALRSWKQGLTMISNRQSCYLLKARCHANMSWGLIQMANDTDKPDFLKQASENAQAALACYKHAIVQDGLERTLCLLGVCAHKSGQAVTAQGLFASALDKEKETLVGKLNYIETLRCYAKLLDDWEKREKEASLMRAKISLVALPEGWMDKSVVSGSIWLFGLGIFT